MRKKWFLSFDLDDLSGTGSFFNTNDSYYNRSDDDSFFDRWFFYSSEFLETSSSSDDRTGITSLSSDSFDDY